MLKERLLLLLFQMVTHNDMTDRNGVFNFYNDYTYITLSLCIYGKRSIRNHWPTSIMYTRNGAEQKKKLFSSRAYSIIPTVDTQVPHSEIQISVFFF